MIILYFYIPNVTNDNKKNTTTDTDTIDTIDTGSNIIQY